MKLLRILKNIFFYLIRKKTIGARVLVINKNKILLVKHTYMKDWYTIGGGVEKGEAPKEAAARELLEEVGIVAKSLSLFNVYHSKKEWHDDYVLLYVCKDFKESNEICSVEIKEKKWFELSSLPQDISPATLRRIKEYIGKKKISEKW